MVCGRRLQRDGLELERAAGTPSLSGFIRVIGYLAGTRNIIMIMSRFSESWCGAALAAGPRDSQSEPAIVLTRNLDSIMIPGVTVRVRGNHDHDHDNSVT
jgi:hypothetical protein